MGKASSAKKVARVAKAGKGSKVRTSQGQVFYVSLAIVAVLGLALIVFARQSGNENRVASPPTLSDHWHEAYGFYTKQMQELGWTWGTHYLPRRAARARSGRALRAVCRAIA